MSIQILVENKRKAMPKDSKKLIAETVDKIVELVVGNAGGVAQCHLETINPQNAFRIEPSNKGPPIKIPSRD